jgi:hypothetical protein
MKGVRIKKRTMEFVIAKKIDPSGDKKKRTVAAIVAMGVKKLVSESLGPPPPPPLRGRL